MVLNLDIIMANLLNNCNKLINESALSHKGVEFLLRHGPNKLFNFVSGIGGRAAVNTVDSMTIGTLSHAPEVAKSTFVGAAKLARKVKLDKVADKLDESAIKAHDFLHGSRESLRTKLKDIDPHIFKSVKDAMGSGKDSTYHAMRHHVDHIVNHVQRKSADDYKLIVKENPNITHKEALEKVKANVHTHISSALSDPSKIEPIRRDLTGTEKGLLYGSAGLMTGKTLYGSTSK